jgi:hypothetical protein
MPRASPELVELAFSEAASALRFGFVPRFSVVLPGGIPVQALGLVRSFGSPAGTLLFCIGMEPSQDQLRAIKAARYSYSALSAESYSSYVEQHFVDTLNDWGYFGAPSGRPKWYSGEVWC